MKINAFYNQSVKNTTVDVPLTNCNTNGSEHNKHSVDVLIHLINYLFKLTITYRDTHKINNRPRSDSKYYHS